MTFSLTYAADGSGLKMGFFDDSINDTIRSTHDGKHRERRWQASCNSKAILTQKDLDCSSQTYSDILMAWLAQLLTICKYTYLESNETVLLFQGATNTARLIASSIVSLCL